MVREGRKLEQQSQSPKGSARLSAGGAGMDSKADSKEEKGSQPAPASASKVSAASAGDSKGDSGGDLADAKRSLDYDDDAPGVKGSK